MTTFRMNPAYRRYLRRMLPLSLLYVGAIALAVRLIPDHAPADARTIGLALLPGLAVVGWVWAMGRLLVELEDEYLRMLEIRKFLVATAFTWPSAVSGGCSNCLPPRCPSWRCSSSSRSGRWGCLSGCCSIA